MNTTLRIDFGDGQVFELAHIKASEMAKVESWTGYTNRPEWLNAISEQRTAALVAALTLAKQRAGENVRFSDVDFDMDDLKVSLVDEQGREVEPVLVTDAEGEPILVKYVRNRPAKDDRGGYIIDDEDGRPVPELDSEGQQVWRYVDSGELVPTVAG